MKIRNFYYFTIGLIFMFIVYIGQDYYRPWVNRNAINDFGLAKFWPSLFGCLCAIFFAMSLAHKQETVQCSIWITIGCAMYEILQPSLGTGYFEWIDLIAVCLTGTMCTFILFQLSKKTLSKEN